MKVLNTMLGSLTSGNQDSGPPEDGESSGGLLGLKAKDIAALLGLPPFAAKMLEEALKPETSEAKRYAWMWMIAHAIFAVGMGLYFLFVIGSSVATYGNEPPPPATAQNPFVVFVTGELLLLGGRAISNSWRGGSLITFGTGVQLFRDLVRDGRIALFLLGLGSWWQTRSTSVP